MAEPGPCARLEPVGSEILSTAAWTAISVGVVIGIYALIGFAQTWPGPRAAGRRETRRPWYELGFGLVSAASGVSLLARDSDAVLWWISSLVTWGVGVWILVSWLRARSRRTPNGSGSPSAP